MRSFTADVEQWFEWFEATHRIDVIGGVAQWQRVALPYAGGAGDQPAKLMEALTFMGQQMNAHLMARTRRTRRANG